MNVLSLFDGMSCGQIALNRANISYDNYFASEIDKYAITITQKHYPNTVRLGDITKWKEWNLPKIDLILAGSPCQGFSVAGKGLNFDDPRSKLFFVFVEILKHYQPRYFLFENVKMKKEWQDIISKQVGVQPILIDSALVSAQSRKRLYWTNISNVQQPEDRKIYWHSIYEEGAKNVFYYTKESFNWIFKSEKRQKRYHLYLPNEKIKMQMLEASHYKGYSNQRCFGVLDLGKVRYISSLECERLQTIEDNWTEGVSNTQRYRMLGNGWTIEVIVGIFEKMEHIK